MSEEEDFEKDNASVYDEESRQEMIDSDELSAEEEGFMKGYEEADGEEEEKEEEEEPEE